MNPHCPVALSFFAEKHGLIPHVHKPDHIVLRRADGLAVSYVPSRHWAGVTTGGNYEVIECDDSEESLCVAVNGMPPKVKREKWHGFPGSNGEYA